MIQEKTLISQAFSLLREYGFTVLNFNSKNRFSLAMKDFVDIVIFDSHLLYFIEVKTKSTKDKLSEGQQDTQEKLANLSLCNNSVFYSVVTNLEEAKNHVDIILRQKGVLLNNIKRGIKCYHK